MRQGFIVLHGNRLEDLATAVLSWLQRHPLPGLEPEAVLVPSNGMAEWFKMTAARELGVCAAMQVELPARFSWRTYRRVLGADGGPDEPPLPVPARLPLDKAPMVWRLMAAMAATATGDSNAAREPPAAGSAHDRSPMHGTDDAVLADAWPAGATPRQQLAWARQVADLLDAYQVYRPDWLDDWEQGHDRLRPLPGTPADAAEPVPADQRWQPALWRWLVGSLGPWQGHLTRPALHREALRRLAQAEPGRWAHFGLPRRVLLFGSTQLPLQTLELLGALARHQQVLLAVPNPCRYDWTDTLYALPQPGVRAARQPHGRLPAREGQAAVPVEDLPTLGHPLLSAWGRQARDFIRALERFDDTQRQARALDIPRIDLFDEQPGHTLLQRLQAQVRDMVSAAELQAQPPTPPEPADRSIVFHAAHGALREVEVLHDQLLAALTAPPRDGDAPLQPRDIVVMVPDLAPFAPAIRAVFGRHPRTDPRHIPWGIADAHERSQLPLLQTVEWLLSADLQRCTGGDLRDLLDLPAWAQRFGLAPDDADELGRWVTAAGLRWGLDAQHRARVMADGGAEPPPSGPDDDLNTWRFALDRLLLGYATGRDDAAWPAMWQSVAPLPGAGALAASRLGSLDAMLAVLQGWWAVAQRDWRPAEWAVHVRALLARAFVAVSEREREALAALDDALTHWLEDAEAAGFDDPVPLAVLREAWLPLLVEPGQQQRFKAGGVTFCTLLPLRTIPFEMVCLLGMNDGDYPRASRADPLDLTQRPGQPRPGDRSGRDDDRQLMLDALLAARRTLYVSWTGRDVRDNGERWPSVLVRQLRDQLDATWGPGTSARLTTEHPLQPFSRRYFEDAEDGAPALFTHAQEWRALHDRPAGERGEAPPPVRLPAATGSADTIANATGAGAGAATVADAADPTRPATIETWTLADLARWLRHPPREWLRHRTGVRFPPEDDEQDVDDEPFGLSPRVHATLLGELLAAPAGWLDASEGLHASVAPDAPDARAARAARRLRRSGQLPWGASGDRMADELLALAQDQRARVDALQSAWPQLLPDADIELVLPAADGAPAVRLSDRIGGLRGSPAFPGRAVRVDVLSSRLFKGTGLPHGVRPDKLIAPWTAVLACAAVGQPVTGWVVAPDGAVALQPPDGAAAALQGLLAVASALRRGPQPPAALPRSGLHQLAGQAELARAAFEGPGAAMATARGLRAERDDPEVRRLASRFDDWCATPDQAAQVQALYGALDTSLRGYLTRHPADAAEAGDG
jgi:exodeoxyribonuclease V gamma subunit